MIRLPAPHPKSCVTALCPTRSFGPASEAIGAFRRDSGPRNAYDWNISAGRGRQDFGARHIRLGAIDITDLLQIIYSSQPFGYDEATLNGVLLDARRCNRRDGVTGALVCRQDIYLQLLEGPEASVKAAFERISRDDRHSDVQMHVSRPVSDRLFGDWAMLHDPARTAIWSSSEISDGALERATPEDFRQVFEALAKSVEAGLPE